MSRFGSVNFVAVMKNTISRNTTSMSDVKFRLGISSWEVFSGMEDLSVVRGPLSVVERCRHRARVHDGQLTTDNGRSYAAAFFTFDARGGRLRRSSSASAEIRFTKSWPWRSIS